MFKIIRHFSIEVIFNNYFSTCKFLATCVKIFSKLNFSVGTHFASTRVLVQMGQTIRPFTGLGLGVWFNVEGEEPMTLYNSKVKKFTSKKKRKVTFQAGTNTNKVFSVANASSHKVDAL